ncbi:MAG: RcpC/CpaB family pilus assembly protein [Actinomycetes bacterium]
MKPWRGHDGRLRVPDARIGVGIGLVALSVLGGLRISGASAPGREVLAYTGSFASGHFVAVDDLEVIDLRLDGPSARTVVTAVDRRDVVGRPLVRAVQEHAPVLTRDLGTSSPDVREITVPITAAHALGGDLTPGDRVDVLATFDGETESARTLVVTSGAEVVTAVRDAAVFGGAGAVSALTLAVRNEDAMFVVFAARTADIDVVRTAATPDGRTRVDGSEVP